MCFPLTPYKTEKVWEAFGLQCVVVQGRQHRFRCGYVRVPEGHPAWGQDDRCVDVDVHGGITFTKIEPCEHDDGQGWWLGFDCAHCDDAYIDPDFAHLPEFALYEGLNDGHWWSHDEVVAETEGLARQLAALKEA